VYSVSCGTAGTCTAGGRYTDGSDHAQAFVVNETSGSWGNAIEVPGSTTLNSGGDAVVYSVSCATAGTCTAGGYYKVGSGNYQAFVVDETSGSWGNAIEVPGIATLNSGGYAEVDSVSCATVGTCAAGGWYEDGSGNQQAFVVDETSGSWGNAIKVPGTANLITGGEAVVNSVSCATAGTCTAGGYYTDGSGNGQAFVVGETSGSWGNAIKVPGTATLSAGHIASVSSVSCATAGCTAGGYYTDGSGNTQAFVVDRTSGSWGNAIEITSALPCIVPQVVGKTLLAAKRALATAHCGLGKVQQTYSTAQKGRVVAQHPTPGTQLTYGAQVALTLSKGKK
jgi:hypothetical protein